MAVLVAIDPGNTSGVAVFANSRTGPLCLYAAWSRARDTPESWRRLVTNHIVPDIIRHNVDFESITAAIEIPQIYRAGASKGDPNSLTGLILQCGWIETLFALPGFGGTTMYRPRQWKGQLPKPVAHRRILEKLSDAEVNLTSGLDDNALDAIGIGLHHIGRKIV